MSDHSERPSAAAEQAWTSLNRAQRRIFERIEVALKAAGLPPLAWYDALLELWRAGAEPLRQVDLERRMLFRQYNVSRLLDRLEGAGLVRRETCSDDARAYRLMATPAGLALRERMWPVYAAAIEENLGGRLEEVQARTLAELLGRLG